MAVPISRIDVRGTTETLFQELENNILTGKVHAGEKLPSEQSIAEQAGVGRRSVREALKALEMKGLIEIRRGSGAFVVRNDLDNYIETMAKNVQSYLRNERAELDHILLFRELISGGIIGRLATDAKLRQAAVPGIEEALERQRTAVERRSSTLYNKAHFDFHFRIVNSVDNPIVSMMYAQVMRVVEPYMKLSGSKMEIMTASVEEHGRILEAVKRGNAKRAQELFRSHLRMSERHLKPLIPPGGPS